MPTPGSCCRTTPSSAAFPSASTSPRCALPDHRSSRRRSRRSASGQQGRRPARRDRDRGHPRHRRSDRRCHRQYRARPRLSGRCMPGGRAAVVDADQWSGAGPRPATRLHDCHHRQDARRHRRRPASRHHHQRRADRAARGPGLPVGGRRPGHLGHPRSGHRSGHRRVHRVGGGDRWHRSVRRSRRGDPACRLALRTRLGRARATGCTATHRTDAHVQPDRDHARVPSGGVHAGGLAFDHIPGDPRLPTGHRGCRATAESAGVIGSAAPAAITVVEPADAASDPDTANVLQSDHLYFSYTTTDADTDLFRFNPPAGKVVSVWLSTS